MKHCKRNSTTVAVHLDGIAQNKPCPCFTITFIPYSRLVQITSEVTDSK